MLWNANQTVTCVSFPLPQAKQSFLQQMQSEANQSKCNNAKQSNAKQNKHKAIQCKARKAMQSKAMHALAIWLKICRSWSTTKLTASAAKPTTTRTLQPTAKPTAKNLLVLQGLVFAWICGTRRTMLSPRTNFTKHVCTI